MLATDGVKRGPDGAGKLFRGFLDRSGTDPGLLHNGDRTVHVFTDRGWRWGGYWRTPTDYQHFERPRSLTSDSAAPQPYTDVPVCCGCRAGLDDCSRGAWMPTWPTCWSRCWAVLAVVIATS